MRSIKAAASLTPLLAALFTTLSSTFALPSSIIDQHQLETSILQSRADSDNGTSNTISPSFDVTQCPGYQLVGEPHQSQHGFTARLAQLALAGDACHAYGVGIANLTWSVVYEKKHQLHVHIYDTAKHQYQLPNGLIFDRPSDNPDEVDGSTAEESDLVFHHTAENGTQSSNGSWAFWIARKSSGDVIFDTRSANIPTYQEGINNVSSDTKRNSTAMPKHEIVFENQYLQLSSALPEDANIYGLGEYVTGSFRRNPDETLQPFFTLDAGTPVDSNQYGYHPVYTEARRGSDGKLRTHTVYLQNTAGMDVLLRKGVIQYRAIGGTLDFRFFSGDSSPSSSNGEKGEVKNSPNTAIQQYVNFIGNPVIHPYWSYGFHLCRWGYTNVSDTQAIVDSMRSANIPLEVQWNDIDYMQEFRDFTTDPSRFPQSEFAAMISKLRENHQHYIPIIDMAIPKAPTNSSDTYYPGTRGDELNVFMKNRNGTEYIGEVWPGYTSFVDQQAENAQMWWTEAIGNFSKIVDFSGIWLDMNEPSSFVIGNAAGPETNLSDTPAYTPATSVAGWPQGYNNLTWGTSGNITVNGSYTYRDEPVQNNDASQQQRRSSLPAAASLSREQDVVLAKRQQSGGDEKYGPNDPDYQYANSSQRYLTNPPYAIHNGIHNGIHISESPLNINLDKKNHLDEPFRWDSVANASRIAIGKRYEILPTLYSHMARASETGEPAVRAIWYEFEQSFEQTKDYAHQFMFGDNLLVSPVLEPNVTEVKALFPDAAGKWRNIFSYQALQVEYNKNVSIPAPLSTINVHLRPGRALLTHSQPAYTIYETAQSPYGLIVNLDDHGNAQQQFYLDDGATPSPAPNSTLTVTAENGKLQGKLEGNYKASQKLGYVVVLDMKQKPNSVSFAGNNTQFNWDEARHLLNVTALQADLNSNWNLTWSS
ncbi:hypothetical protein NDA16_002325 [Ustilago loliicola]|nr:hypothetical protein NDA16_002325 [Ustilago loliicola]